MNVNQRNALFASGGFDREDAWPKLIEYEQQALTFRFKFGLEELPIEPGILFVRGPRQYGKSTWLEYMLRETLEDFGKGSGFFLNGDDIPTAELLEREILKLLAAFHPKAKVNRLFIDEITSVPGWEKVLKRLADRRELGQSLLITTGSSARDLRRGAERLPGRKGKLARTEYIFTGVSYKDFHAQCFQSLQDDTWIAYLLSGGSPIAAKEIWQFERIPDYVFELNRDWIIGEIVRTGRSRSFLFSVLHAIEKKAGSRAGFLGLAKDAGLANNTLAAEYVEQLSDLLSVIPSLQWDAQKQTAVQRKPCKFHFINLSVALAFSRSHMKTVHDFKSLPNSEQGKWVEWLVAQEIFRRQCIRGGSNPEGIYYWASKEHEIDFVDSDEVLYEVKLGKTSPIEFGWFAKTFPKKRLIVISQSEFETSHVKGVTFDQFLLADGFPHPYPGQVDDPDIYNDVLRFQT